jgi:monoamine oxidase
LKNYGLASTVYEAATRTGGRIMTSQGLMAAGLTTELGGEFIDSTHEDMLLLAAWFGLPLLDFESPAEQAFETSYFFGGRNYSEAEIVESFTPLAAIMENDLATVGDISYLDPAGGQELDATSIADYLDEIGAEGMIRDLLQVAYVTEYGLDADAQSALNLLFLIGLDPQNRFEMFGTSDERYKIDGGNQQIVDALAGELRGQIEKGQRLVSLASRGSGYRLRFAVDGRCGTKEVNADVVILALPFTLLREVELNVKLPAVKLRAIRELGYGTNAKVFAGTSRRVWREQARTGEAFTDEALQLCWDNAWQQPGMAGGLTFFSGGTPGLAAGLGTAASQVANLAVGLERIFPGVCGALNGAVSRFHWPTYPLSKGSYAAYRPGQWSTIAGVEGEPVGNLFFAGEHCSAEFQGYMNGGAETGRVAAEAVVDLVRNGGG